MTSGSFQKILIFLMLGLLTASAFFVRLGNFKNSQKRSIDEIVYYRMAKQVAHEGFSGYHTIPYGKELAATGRQLPKYFFQPLFKHPPVFTFLAALSMKLFGNRLISAEYVSLLLSVLMIPLVYVLGAHVFDRRIGILSAFVLWMDPINIICSQKVWMDTTIAFFVLLSALFFVMGLKRNNDWFFILSGITSGFAVNTKYTGILITFVIVFYCLIYRRDLFNNKKFHFSLALPFLMLVPWLFWNLKIYGITSVLEHSELKFFYAQLMTYLPVVLVLGLLVVLIFYFLSRYKKNLSSNVQLVDSADEKHYFRYFSMIITVIFFTLVVPKPFIHSLQFNYLPTHSWRQLFFSKSPPSFYFGRLLEFSPIYILSLTSVFLFHVKQEKEVSFIRLCAMVILLFFIFWRNFQSRYILSSLPFFILIGVQFGIQIFEQVSNNRNRLIAFGGRMGLKLFFAYIIVKCYYVNIMVSYPNDMCYF